MLIESQPIKSYFAEKITQTSIIIVNYNSWPALQRCLLSLEKTGNHNVETVIVDNASTDGCPELIATNFPAIQLVRNPSNLGYGAGSNIGAAITSGEYLVFLNPDTRVEPGWMEPLIKTLEENSTAGLATAKILLISDEEKINTCGNTVHLSGLAQCRGLGDSKEEYSKIEEVPAISGAAFAIRKDLFESLGGFDEDFFMYVEDTDLSLRARMVGYRCLFVPTSVIYHDYNLRIDSHKTYFQERNRYQMLLKCFYWQTLLVLLPTLILAEVVTWGFILWHDRQNLANKLKAYAWIIIHWREIMLKREAVQAKRIVTDRELLQLVGHKLYFEHIDNGVLPEVAHMVFDPLFYGLQKIAIMFIRW